SASTDFRLKTWDLWMHDYFPERPWLGRGFGFKREWAKPPAYNPKATDYRQNVEVQNIHNGLFAAVDTFGIIGTIFFVIWNLRILARTFRVSFQGNDARGMTLRFLALYLAVWIGSYWWGALHVGMFLPQEFALAGVLLRLQEVMALAPTRTGAAIAKAEQGLREELANAQS